MPLVDPIEVMGDLAGKHAMRRLDLADVAGQTEAKWACEVAAAGRHHMLFHGSPGVGKTMLAERLPGLLPDLDLRDSLEVSAVHSPAGFNLADELITRPPYSDPHHSASVASIVGGGQRMARPGAISCAHRGVLFLDDSTEPQSTRWREFIPLPCGGPRLGRDAGSCDRIPDPDRLVVAAGGGQPAAVRGDRHRPHVAGVAGEGAAQGRVREVGQGCDRLQARSGQCVPQPFSHGGQGRILGQTRQQHPGQGAGRVEGGEYRRVLPDHLLQGGAGGVAG